MCADFEQGSGNTWGARLTSIPVLRELPVWWERPTKTTELWLQVGANEKDVSGSLEVRVMGPQYI